MDLTPLQQRVLAEIRRGGGGTVPKGYPKTYDAGTGELQAARDLADLGLVFHAPVTIRVVGMLSERMSMFCY